MSKTNTLLTILTVLIGIDYVATAIFVGSGMCTEINPVMILCGGFVQFMAVKLVISLIGIVTIYKTDINVNIEIGFVIMLTAVYLTVNLHNLIQLIVR